MAGKTPVLIMIQGHDPGARWELQETRVTTIGRSSRNVISLLNPSVSRFHCEISYINGLWYVADLNSRKGTFLNGRQISEREVIKAGDVLRLSRNVFKFDLVDEGAGDNSDLLAIREAASGMDVAAAAQAVGGAEAPAAADEEEKVEAPGGFSQEWLVLLGVVLAVALGTGGVLAYAHNLAGSMRSEQAERVAMAGRGFQKASELVEAGPARYREALEALSAVVRDYPDQAVAEQAAAIYRQEEGKWADREMNRITSMEGDGNYRDALERASDLLGGLSDGALKGLVKERQQFTMRLAGAAYNRMREDAQQRLSRGDADGAARIYEEAIARILSLIHI